jgi:hypothetical protein
MTGFKNGVCTLVLMMTALSVSGCQSVGDSMSSLKNTISDIKIASIFGEEETNTLLNKEGTSQATEDTAEIRKAGIDAEKILNTEDYKCPAVSIVEDLDKLTQFTDMSAPAPSNKVSNIVISDTVSGCTYNDNNIIVQMNIRFEGDLGPDGRVWQSDAPRFSYPYFIAVTNSQGNILAKEVYALTVSYQDGEQEIAHEERLRQIIPIPDGSFGADHEILIGFQLTEQELAYNRQKSESITEMLAEASKNVSNIEPAAGNVLQEQRQTSTPDISLKEEPVEAELGIQESSEDHKVVPDGTDYPVFLYDQTFGE